MQDLGEKANDIQALEKAFLEAKQVEDKPSLIVVRSHIGFGSPNKQDTPGVHGSPLGEEEIKLTKQAYGWPENESFLVPLGQGGLPGIHQRGLAHPAPGHDRDHVYAGTLPCPV